LAVVEAEDRGTHLVSLAAQAAAAAAAQEEIALARRPTATDHLALQILAAAAAAPTIQALPAVDPAAPAALD
jgi:hypothetical protein